MEQRELRFSALEDNYGGVLPLKEVHYFYYDICFDCEMGYSLNYEWNKDVETFLDKNGIIIKVELEKDIPTSFEKNKLFFSLAEKDKKNKAAAFFRHLRNSFSHYEIGYNNGLYNMKDFRYDQKEKALKCTMIGCIEKTLLEQLISMFFGQKAIIEENYNRYLYPEI